MIFIVALFPFDIQTNRQISGDAILDIFAGDRLFHWKDVGEIILSLFLFCLLGFSTSSFLKLRLKIDGKKSLIFSGVFCIFIAVSEELIQLFMPSRFPSITDIIFGVMGGIFGGLCFHYWRFEVAGWIDGGARRFWRWISVPKLAIALAAYTGLALALSLVLKQSINFHDWDANFPLILGNEIGAPRPWNGTVATLCIADSGLSESEISQLFAAPESCEAIAETAIASYHFQGPGPYRDRAGHLPDLVWMGTVPTPVKNQKGVQLNSQQWLQTPEPATVAIQNIRETAAFTIGILIASADSDQVGPARIVSISGSPYDRNLTVAQLRSHLLLRLRTPLTGKNGENPEFLIPNLFRDPGFHHVIIAWDRFNLRFYIDTVASEFRLDLTPGVIFFIGSASAAGRRIDVTAFDTAVYQLTYRFLIFVPSGMGLAAIAVKLRPVNRWEGLAIAVAAVGPAILMEIIFAAWNGQNGSAKHMVLDMAVAGVTLGWARSQIAAALRQR